jgi:hypothetical protein
MTAKRKASKKKAAKQKTKTISGNYFAVSVQRLVPGTDLTGRVCATDGSIEGPIFTAGMIHNSAGSPEFIAYAGGKAIYEGPELEEASLKVWSLW